MKNRFSKLLSLLVCLSMLLSMAVFSPIAAAEDTIELDSDGFPVVYVSGAKGDDATTTASAEKPAKTVARAVELINAQNVAEATVMISNETSAAVTVGGNLSLNDPPIPAHTAMITYTTWDIDTTDTVQRAHLAFYERSGNGFVNGPSTFENLLLIGYDGGSSIALSGHDVTLGNSVRVMRYNAGTSGYVRDPSVTFIMGMGNSGATAGQGSHFVMSKSDLDASSIDVTMDSTISGYATMTDSVSLTVNNGTDIRYLNLTTNASSVYKEQVNVILNNKSTVASISNKNAAAFEGGLFIIANGGSSVPAVTGIDNAYVLNVSTDKLVLGMGGEIVSNASGHKYIYAVTSDNTVEQFDASTATAIIPSKPGVYTIRTGDTSGGLLMLARDTHDNWHYRITKDNGTYAPFPEDCSVPEMFASRDEVVKAIRSTIDVSASGNVGFPKITFEDDGTITLDTQYKQVLDLTTYGALNYKSNGTYSAQKTVLYGMNVYKYTVNEGADEAEVYDSLVLYNDNNKSLLIDTDGNPVMVDAMRYLSIYYYYVPADMDNAPFAGYHPNWYQLRMTDGTTGNLPMSTSASSSGYTGEASNTIRPGEWSTITIDLFQSANWLDRAKNQPDLGPSQFKLYFLGGTDSTTGVRMADGDVLYIGNMVLTNYDPAGTLNNIVFVSEEGSDSNSGFSKYAPVKTIAKAAQIVSGREDATVLVSGNIVYDAENVDTVLTFASSDPEYATITFDETKPLASDTILSTVNIAGTVANNGKLFRTNSDVTGKTDIVMTSGGSAVLGGGEYGTITTSGAQEDGANINIGNTSVDSLVISGTEKVVTVGVSGGKLGTLSGNGNIGSLQMLLTADSKLDDRFEGTHGTKHIVYLPDQLSWTGTYFEVNGTDTPGVFETYSGTEYSFGWGPIKYMIYTKSADGLNYYYSNEKTDYTLTLPSGTYQLDLCGEKTWTTSNNKTITGFTTSACLELPDGYVAWHDDNKGTFTASTVHEPSAEYYVMYGGTGNGKTAETAAPTISSVITTIKADGHDVSGKAVKIYVMDYVDPEDDSNSWYNYAGGEGAEIGRVDDERKNQAHHMSAWAAYGSESAFPAHNATLIITSYDYANDGETNNHLAFTTVLGPNSAMFFGGPVVFENINLVHSRRDYREFATRGNDVTFGKGVNVLRIKNSGDRYPDSASKAGYFVFHNDMIFETANTNLALGGYQSSSNAGGTVRVGYSDYASMNGDRGIALPSFSTDMATTFSNTVKLYIENDNLTVPMLWGSWVSAKEITDSFNGGFAVIVNNAGTLGVRTMGSNVVINNGYIVICNNGETFPAYPEDKVTVNGGEWYLNSADTNGNRIDYYTKGETGTTRTFDVIGGLTAKASNENGATYYSEDAKLVLPEGKYTIEYVDYTPYEIIEDTENKKVAVKANIDGIVIDITTLPVYNFEGKLFMGWETMSDVVTLNTGDTLSAMYVDFDTTVDAENEEYGDLGIIGAQMRFTDEEAGVSEGLRFVTQLSSELRGKLGIADHPGEESFDGTYGTLVIPTENLSGDLTFDTAGAIPVAANKLFEKTGDYYRYTAVITDIALEYYNREFTARSYVKYQDVNGIDRVAYGDSYALALYDMADYILKNEQDLDDDKAAHLEQLCEDTVDWLETKTGNYIYTGMENVDGVPTEGAYKRGEVIYLTNSGVRMREIHFDGSDNADAEPVEIAVVSDTHFIHYNEEDWKDAELLFTNKTRSWGRGGTHIPYMKKAMELASKYDYFVGTGDIIDFLTRGSLELLDEFMIQPTLGKGMILLGNHDQTKQNETRASDKVSYAERIAMMQEVWPHDILYTSKVLGNNVMVIGFDNGTYKCTQDQYEKMKADIETARENGYIVLLFYHIPFAVGGDNPNYTASCMASDRNCTNSYNFYTGDPIGGPEDNLDVPTRGVYDLIKNNGDIIKGMICGHEHEDIYTEFNAFTPDGEPVIIPQHIMNSNAYFKNGNMCKITIK